ncbi:MAG: peptidase family protein [Chloroflexi bacterium]|nr:peptidase family protein [Chloroflexota bacterium]
MPESTNELLTRWLEETERWVYQFEPTHLTREASRKFEYNRFAEIHQGLDEQATASNDPVEAAQLWLKLALHASRVGDLEKAEKFLRNVRPPKISDQHYVGIANWMVGCLYWYWSEPDRGSREWEAARQAFTQAKEGKVESHLAWYDHKIRLMDDALQQARERGGLPPLPPDWSMLPPTGGMIDSDLTPPALRLTWPAASRRITQNFGENPEHFKQFKLPGHEGIDFFAEVGDPVYAAADGVVRQADQPEGHAYGMQVRIQHVMDGLEYETIYAHLSETLVRAGQTVQTGETIARAGQSGNATGPHLHFVLKIKGRSTPGYPNGIVDPTPYLEVPPEPQEKPLATSPVDQPDPALLAQLESDKPEERITAVRGLALYAASSAPVRKRLRKLLTDTEPGVRMAVGEALLSSLSGDQAARKDFRTRLDPAQEAEPIVRAAFVRFLAEQSNVPWVRGDLEKRLSDDSPQVRLAAVESLAELAGSNDRVRAALTRMLDDPDADVQQAARRALGMEPPPPEPLTPPRPFAEDAIDKSSASDQPITRLEDDQLGFKPYVLGLRDFIASDSTGTPLTIGVDGTWGSGKSSLMGMLRAQLDPPSGSLEAQKMAEDRQRWRAAYWRELPHLVWAKLALWRNPAWTDKDLEARPDWVKSIEAGMSFDPTIHDKKEVNAWEDPQAKKWADISERTSPMRPAHPTVWFNAWKFDAEEQVWAALAVEVTNQIKAHYNGLERLAFWWGLTWRRFKPLEAIWMLVRKILVPLLLILAYLAYMNIADSNKNPLPAPLDRLKLEDFYGYLLLLGALVAAFLNVSKILKDPFQLNLKELTRAPDYQGKIGFIGQFQEDFRHIVAQATRPRLGWRQRKLVIFIDDLDRCEPPKAANIVEAMNIFLDSPQCVFVVGMDMRAVAASIWIKYKDVFGKMKEQDISLVAPERIFLDKIIQVPIHLPQPGEDYIGKLVEKVTRKEKRLLIAPPKRVTVTGATGVATDQTSIGQELTPDLGKGRTTVTPTEAADQSAPTTPTEKTTTPVVVTPPDVASISREDIQKAIEQGSHLLGDNPRQVKRFINLFRLHVYIADQNKILEMRGKKGLDLTVLATWVAFSLRYAEVVQSLMVESSLEEQAGYLQSLVGIIEKIKEGKVYRVKDYTGQVARLEKERQAVKGIPSHWWGLPWQVWMLESDFCQAVYDLGSIWPLPAQGQEDWLKRLIRMSKVTG